VSERFYQFQPLCRRQCVPEGRGLLTAVVHRGCPANAPARAALATRFSVILRRASNQRYCVWGIENRSHYVRDGTFAEDASRIRKKPGVFARIRSFAVNILRFNRAENVANTRYSLAIGGIAALQSIKFM
jgi:hypothetical protein